MTTLDDRLYTWLSESDEQRFVRAFNAYFAAAFPAVIRHLARTASSDPALLEEIAQDALLKFFDKFGHGRRVASETVARALSAIRPLSLGALHHRHVTAWTQDVEGFRYSVMTFQRRCAESEGAAESQKTDRDLALQIPPLQMRGWHLIDYVRIALQWDVERSVHTKAATESDPDLEDDVAESDGADDGTIHSVPDAATVNLAKAVLHDAAAVQTADSVLPGSIQFVHGTATVIGALPRLRVPTNGYLFQIATSIFLDDYRRKASQKRGGAKGTNMRDSVEPGDSGGVTVDLHAHLVGHEGHPGEITDFPALGGSAGAPRSIDGDHAGTDPVRQWEDTEYFERFYDYLRAPLADAEKSYARACLRGAAVAERRKCESLAQKLSRTLAVLSAIGEGYTQEETAERLGLTRNQVKYVIETLQEAYARFAASSNDPAQRRPSSGVSSHAR